MKRKAQVAWMWITGLLAIVAIIIAGLWKDILAALRKQEKQVAREELAAELKAKVAEVHAQRAEEKAAVAVAVAKIEAQAEADKARDSVDVANDLIADARK
jgi:FtsZ-interacting cell division protein ZipA